MDATPASTDRHGLPQMLVMWWSVVATMVVWCGEAVDAVAGADGLGDARLRQLLRLLPPLRLLQILHALPRLQLLEVSSPSVTGGADEFVDVCDG